MNQQPSFEKNYFTAIALSALVLFVYFTLVKPPQPAAPAKGTAAVAIPAATSTEKTAQQNSPIAEVKSAGIQAAQPAEIFSLESAALKLELSNIGATATQLDFKGEPGREALTETSFFQGDIERPGIFAIGIKGQAEQLTHSIFTKISSTGNEAVFVYEEAGIFKMTKTYRLLPHSPALELEVKIENFSGTEKTFPLEVTYGFDYHEEGRPQPGQYFEAVAFTNGLKTANARKIEKKGFWISEPAAWGALVKRYFALIVRPDRKVLETRAEAHEGKLMMTMTLEPLAVGAAQSAQTKLKIYAGPQRYEMLKNFEDGFQDVLSRGFFGFFKMLLLRTLLLLNRLTHNFGWAILLLTLLIKVIFAPLTVISSKSMKKMQALAPKQKDIQEKYKNDPTRAQREIMELYKRNKVNPLSGCLPMLIQFPILIAMFRLLPEAIELHGAPFIFWIKDLSAPDHFMELPFTLPILGAWFNLLPIVMIISQVGYQRLMPQVSTQPEQKMMMNIMPFFFGFISWAFPSGLVLYWIFQNVFSMIQQLHINRIQTDIHPEDR